MRDEIENNLQPTCHAPAWKIGKFQLENISVDKHRSLLKNSSNK